MSGRPESMRWIVFALLALVAGLVGAACSIQPDSAPHDIPPDAQERLRVTQPDNEAVGALDSDRIYLVAPGNPSLLRAVLREGSGTVRGRIESLFEGPTDADLERNLTTALPAGLALNSVTVSTAGDIITIDVGDDLLNLPESEQRLAIAQIVYTATRLQPTVQVVVKVDDVAQAWPVADGSLQRGGLTIYDYQGLVESSQPAYPQPIPRVPTPATESTVAATTSPVTTTPETTSPATTAA